ncbi:MAG: phosphopentomutase [Clostridia bacterium]|nr:phosphopentomutase [Clostridia bacterium]
MKRIFLIVLDSVGVGFLPDAAEYGDSGADTMRRISRSEKFNIPTLIKLGLGNINGIDYLESTDNPLASYGKMCEISKGKDTTTGHWEIAGLNIKKPFPTYSGGFPDSVIKEFEEKTGRKVICNKVYSGTEVIKDYGEEHIESGALIVYTSADSVFQIAAHEDVVGVEELYRYCEIAREILKGEHGVGRVIARPFTGEYPFSRTSRRHDYSLAPIGQTVLDALKDNGYDVIAVGKINDIFASHGITKSISTTDNDDGMRVTDQIVNWDFNGLCFVNLVDFDMVYGHRNNIDGYAEALSNFDKWLSEFLPKLNSEDMLIITADHGCDPGDNSTDHTREYAPVLVYGGRNTDLGVRHSFADIAATISDIFSLDYKTHGVSFKKELGL